MQFDLQKLLKKKYRPLWHDYADFVNQTGKHFAKEGLSREIKEEKLYLLEKAIRKEFPFKNSKLARLQKQFVRENLSLYLLLDFLPVWRRMACGTDPENEMQLSEVLNSFAAPKARMLMVLNNESPSTYLPMTSALVAAFLLDSLQNKSNLVRKVKWSRRQQISKLTGLLKSSWVVLALVKSKRLKFYAALFLNNLKLQIERFKNNKQPNFTVLDVVMIFLYSAFQFVVIRKKTVERERL